MRSHSRLPRIAVAAFALTVAACDRNATGGAQASPALPPLPPLALREVLAPMRALAANAPAAPDARRAVLLAELVDLAWRPDAADARTQARSQRSLLEEDGVDFALEAGLAHESPAVRSQCAFQLGERGRVAAIPILLVRVRQDERDPEVLAWMIDALCKLGCLGALDRLPPLFAAEPGATRAGALAIEIQKRVGRDPGEAPDWATLGGGITALHDEWRAQGRLPGATDAGAPAIDTVEPLLRARLAQCAVDLADANLRPVDNARFVFSRIGRTGLAWVAELLHADNEYVRRYGVEIATALGRSAAPIANDLAALLADPFTATLATRAFGDSGHPAALPHLLARLRHADPDMRVAAAIGLAACGDAVAFAALRARLDDQAESTDVKVHAAWALAVLSPGDRYLAERVRAKDYHEPTLLELLDELARRRR